MLDRAKLDRLIASAVHPEIVRVDLPVIGETVSLRRPNRAELTRIIAAAGTDLDFNAQVMVGVLRFAMVDDAGIPLLRSFDEAAQVMNSFADGDIAVLLEHLQQLFTAAADGGGDVDLGKAL